MTDIHDYVVDELSETLGVQVSVQYAPIRRLDDGTLAGAELQLRGPSTSALGSAEALRHAARLMEGKATLDRSARALARSDAARTIAGKLPLLVGVDIDSLDETAPEADDGPANVHRLVVSVRVKDVFDDPQTTLTRVADARARGHAICLDGLGDDENAAALLSLIEPDIVRTSAEYLPRTVDLTAHTERTGAIVISEGVDTEALAQSARTLGATYGIGRLYPAVDDPSTLLDEPLAELPVEPVDTTPPTKLRTPYEIAAELGPPRQGTRRLLDQMSRALEARAAVIGSSMVVLGTFQGAHYYELAASRWRQLAETTGYAGVYGQGMTHMLDGNVQHAPLSPDDPLAVEWTVAIIGPHHAALLTARDENDNGPEHARTFSFHQSFDRTVVTQAVHSILMRFTTQH